MYKADKRLYLTADRSRVVEEGDPEAASLLAAEGQEILDAEAERLGLTGTAKSKAEPVVVHSTAADPPKEEESAETEDKAVEKAPANKARAKAEDK